MGVKYPCIFCDFKATDKGNLTKQIRLFMKRLNMTAVIVIIKQHRPQIH